MFDLYIGPNFWVTIDTQKNEREEIFHIPRSNILDLCLVKTGPSTPLISAIEIRPLPNNNYITTSGSLKLLSRFYLSNSEDVIRRVCFYYDDPSIFKFVIRWLIDYKFRLEITGTRRMSMIECGLHTIRQTGSRYQPVLARPKALGATTSIYFRGQLLYIIRAPNWDNISL